MGFLAIMVAPMYGRANHARKMPLVVGAGYFACEFHVSFFMVKIILLNLFAIARK